MANCSGCEERKKLMLDVYEAQRAGDYKRRDELLRQVMSSTVDDVKKVRDEIIARLQGVRK